MINADKQKKNIWLLWEESEKELLDCKQEDVTRYANLKKYMTVAVNFRC